MTATCRRRAAARFARRADGHDYRRAIAGIQLATLLDGLRLDYAASYRPPCVT